jgi:hypothetical protein
MKKGSKEIIEFQKHMFISLLATIRDYGIKTYDEIVNFKAKGMLDEPLWKILEANGKYKGKYISSGIKEIADKLNMSPNGIKVSEIETYLKYNIDYRLSSGMIISNHQDFKVQLEHVTPRKIIIREILKFNKEEDVSKYLDEKCVGCLVLKAEHKVLNDNTYNSKDLWQRYKDADVRVFDTEKNEWIW